MSAPLTERGEPSRYPLGYKSASCPEVIAIEDLVDGHIENCLKKQRRLFDEGGSTYALVQALEQEIQRRADIRAACPHPPDRRALRKRGGERCGACGQVFLEEPPPQEGS